MVYGSATRSADCTRVKHERYLSHTRAVLCFLHVYLVPRISEGMSSEVIKRLPDLPLRFRK
jgi:hypothetical protein